MEFWDCQPERMSYTRLSTLPCAGGFIVGLLINALSISNAPESEAPVLGSNRVDSETAAFLCCEWGWATSFGSWGSCGHFARQHPLHSLYSTTLPPRFRRRFPAVIADHR
jgi:hypothetical protein